MLLSWMQLLTTEQFAKSDLCKRATVCPPTTSFPLKETISDRRENCLTGTRRDSVIYLLSVCLSVRRQPSEEAFRTAVPEGGRGAEAPGGQRTSGGAESGQCNTQGRSLWDTKLGKHPMRCKSAKIFIQNQKKTYLKQIGPCLTFALLF